jgi:glycosyltransferase involved in cell wall biosynthesis
VRIGFDAKRLYNNFTGLGNYSRFLVSAIHQTFPSEEIVLFTPSVKTNSDTKPYLDDKTIQTVLPSGYMTKLKLGSYWRTFSLAEESRKHKLSLFHGLSHELPRGISSTTRSVVTVHDLIFLRYPGFYTSIDRAIYTKKVSYACRQADVIVAISSQTKQDVIEFLKVPERKVQVVYQGCHPNFKKSYTHNELETIRVKYNLPDEFLLSVGTLEERKNTLHILKALVLLKDIDIPLVLVGKPTAYLQQLTTFIHQHGLAGKVHFLHSVAFADLPAIYRMARSFIYPSRFEGFGIPLVEAIQCGVPVITSTGSCFSEAAGPSSLYVSPDDTDQMADAIRQVIQHESVRNKMISESLQYIERFEPGRIASDMMAVYHSIV